MPGLYISNAVTYILFYFKHNALMTERKKRIMIDLETMCDVENVSGQLRAIVMTTI